MISTKYKRLANFGYASFLTILSVCLVIFWLSLSLESRTLVGTVNGQEIIADFIRYYLAGYMTLHDPSHGIYDPAVQFKWMNAVIAPMHVNDIHYVQYSPVVFPLMTPFALLPLNIAYLAWGTFSLTFAACCLYILLWLAGKSDRLLFPFFIAAVVCSLPSWIALRSGQSSWILLGLVSVYALAFLKKMDLLAGLALALSTIKPQYLPCLALPALARRRFMLLGFAVAGEACLLALAGQSIGWQNVVNYPRTVLMADAVDKHVGPEVMVCYRAILSRFLDHSTALQLSMVLMLVVLTVGLILFWSIKQAECSEADRWLLAVCIVGATLLSPHTHNYDCLILAVPAAVTLTCLTPVMRDGKGSKVFRIWSILLIAMPVLSWLNMPIFLGVQNAEWSSYLIIALDTWLFVLGLQMLGSHLLPVRSQAGLAAGGDNPE